MVLPLQHIIPRVVRCDDGLPSRGRLVPTSTAPHHAYSNVSMRFGNRINQYRVLGRFALKKSYFTQQVRMPPRGLGALRRRTLKRAGGV